jgi:hypothetical protein
MNADKPNWVLSALSGVHRRLNKLCRTYGATLSVVINTPALDAPG